jgi:hypothetical protein
MVEIALSEKAVLVSDREIENTINQLMDVLDDNQLIEAVDEVKDGRSQEERVAGRRRGDTGDLWSRDRALPYEEI